jgi:AbrB family looped-hinge helix DNA binding protein
MKELVSRVSSKGQVTIPVEIRKLLGLRPGNKVAFQVFPEGVKLSHLSSNLETSFKAVPALKTPLPFSEMADIAREEHAKETATEGL